MLAVEIGDYDDFRNSGKLIIELPTEPAAREAVFARHAEQAESMGFGGERDMEKKVMATFMSTVEVPIATP